VSVFCRHNRFAAECPICSKGTPLDQNRPAPRRRAASGPRAARGTTPAPAYTGPYAAAGPYEDDEGHYEVRLERVPGGLRLAEWVAGSMRRRAPVLPIADVAPLLFEAGSREVLPNDDSAALADALAEARPARQGDEPGRSPGRAGELREELRVERLEGDRIRIGRWILRPNFGWELQETPVMLPPARYVEAIGGAARAGALARA
jgi:hypothetical protein